MFRRPLMLRVHCVCVCLITVFKVVNEKMKKEFILFHLILFYYIVPYLSSQLFAAQAKCKNELLLDF